VVCIVAIHFGFWAENISAFSQEAQDLDEVTPSVAPDEIVGVFVQDWRFRGERHALRHFGDRLTLKSGMVVVSDLYDYPFAMVRRGGKGEDADLLPSYLEMQEIGATGYDDLSHIRYLIIRCGASQCAELDDWSTSGSGEFEISRESGAWRLYERRGG
jgi:hypothetical protein